VRIALKLARLQCRKKEGHACISVCLLLAARCLLIVAAAAAAAGHEFNFAQVLTELSLLWNIRSLLFC
jgi:hypothetical protein